MHPQTLGGGSKGLSAARHRHLRFVFLPWWDGISVMIGSTQNECRSYMAGFVWLVQYCMRVCVMTLYPY